jgi:hypothetical protein
MLRKLHIGTILFSTLLMAMTLVWGATAERNSLKPIGKPVTKPTIKKIPCPGYPLIGNITKLEANKSQLEIEAKGFKYQVTVTKNAKITLKNKPVKLKDLRVGMKVSAFGPCTGCGPHPEKYTADKICEYTPPPSREKRIQDMILREALKRRNNQMRMNKERQAKIVTEKKQETSSQKR